MLVVGGPAHVDTDPHVTAALGRLGLRVLGVGHGVAFVSWR
ncbi:MAG: hypothetical protein WAL16_00870 [Streptosporangiaceae bacterium]